MTPSITRRQWLGNLCAGLMGLARPTAKPGGAAAVTRPEAGTPAGGAWAQPPEPLSIVTYTYDPDGGLLWLPGAGNSAGPAPARPEGPVAAGPVGPDPFRYDAIGRSDLA